MAALIARLEAYPNTLPEDARGYNDSEYYQAYEPATVALEEALLRFPDDPLVDRWRWQLAYNYVRSGDARAASMYASLMEAALAEVEGDERPLETLPAWFARHEQRLRLAPAGAGSPIPLLRLAVATPEETGSSGAYFYLKEEAGKTHIYPLAYQNAFDLAHGAGMEAGVADVTGDGHEELIAVHAHQPGGNSTFYYTDLLVYELATDPPRLLPFSPPANTHLGWGQTDGWTVVEAGSGPRLQVRQSPSERCDAVATVTVYAWSGEKLQEVESGYEIGESAGSRYCLPFVFAAAEAGQDEALRYLEESVYRGGPEQADEWRYRLGLYHALAGNREEAAGYLEDLIAKPAGNERAWIRNATRFLDGFETPAGLYGACGAADLCNTSQALRRLVELQPPTAYALTAQQLRTWGVPVTRWGYFDMEGDGTLEQWLLVAAGARFEFWIVVPGEDGVRARFVDTIAGNAYAAEMARLTEVGGTPILRLDNGRERILFTYRNDTTVEDQPLVMVLRLQSANESDNYTAQLLSESQTALWKGEEAAPVAETLVRFRQDAEFDCMPGSLNTICPEYAYTLGLAQELSGDEAAATATYLGLWQEYPDTPYATMARSRVAPVPVPTQSPTITVTPES